MLALIDTYILCFLWISALCCVGIEAQNGVDLEAQ